MGMVIVVLVNVGLVALLGVHLFGGGSRTIKSTRRPAPRPQCRWTVIRQGIFHS